MRVPVVAVDNWPTGTFAMVRLRTKVTKGPGSRPAGLAMVFKLVEAASEHWRYFNGANLVALVRAAEGSDLTSASYRPGRADFSKASGTVSAKVKRARSSGASKARLAIRE